MFRSLGKSIRLALIETTLVTALALPSMAFTLISPTDGQAVRENVKIQVPASVVSEKGFISVRIGDGSPKFVMAVGRETAKEAKGILTFYWNSKSPYYDSSSPRTLNYFKDGMYPFVVDIHSEDGKISDTAILKINLKNKVARTNPAPAVRLVNRLVFGQSDTFGVHADVEVFDAVGLPVMGGLGMQNDFKIIQSVEDVRSAGELLLRCRIDEKATVSSLGVDRLLYPAGATRPQLYRLVTKYGKVLNKNMFSKQSQYAIMDVLPNLPTNPVNEGDSWPDILNLKLEGLTPMSTFTGSARLDSFEWQNGQECAKIVSNLSGNSPVALLNGKIRSTGTVTANVTTYYAYKAGRMLKREITLEFPASVSASSADFENPENNLAEPSSASANNSPDAYSDDSGDDDMNQPMAPPPSARPTFGRPSARPGVGGSMAGTDTSTKKGVVRINVVVRAGK